LFYELNQGGFKWRENFVWNAESLRIQDLTPYFHGRLRLLRWNFDSVPFLLLVFDAST